jgi:acyl-coenzyme A thioesterase PaaI-like protein
MSGETGLVRLIVPLGKDLVRVCRVVRDGDRHHVAEYTVRGEWDSEQGGESKEEGE